MTTWVFLIRVVVAVVGGVIVFVERTNGDGVVLGLVLIVVGVGVMMVINQIEGNVPID